MNQETNPSVGRESDKFMLRFPDGMRDRIAAAAKESGRSMNAEIVARLMLSFSGSVNDAILASTVARLNLNISAAELREYTARSEAHNLALLAQKAADALLAHIPESDSEARQVLIDLATQAKPHIKDSDAWESELLEKVAKIREANQHLRQASERMTARVLGRPAGGVDIDVIAQAADGSTMLLEAKKPSRPEFSDHADEPPSDPPTRRVRIRNRPEQK